MKKVITLLAVAFCLNTNAQCGWAPLGSTDSNQINYTAAYYTSMTLDTHGTPYLVYCNPTTPWKINVMKFNGVYWDSIGNKNFSAGGSTYSDIAIDKNGVPYVCYSDGVNGSKATVMKYNGTAWVTVGTAGFSPNSVTSIQIVIDTSGTPYVGFSDNAQGKKASVMEFNGTNWVYVGAAGFSNGTTNYNSIALDKSGNIYVAYQDNPYNVTYSSYGLIAAVKKFNGTSWVNVDSSSLNLPSQPNIFNISFAIDSSGMPYLGYCNSFQEVNVLKFNGTSWGNVSPNLIATDSSSAISFNLDKNGTPYIFYADFHNPNIKTAIVKKYNGTNWITIGNTRFANPDFGNSYNSSSIVIDSSGVPYVCFADDGFNGVGRVMKCVGSNWNIVGPSSFVSEGVEYIAMALDASGNPYVSYNDELLNHIIVKKYTGANWSSIGPTDTIPGTTASLSYLAIDNTGNPNIAYYNNYNWITVKKFNGTSWTALGNTNFSNGDIGNFVFDANNTPYVSLNLNNGEKEACVMKLNGTTWDTVGLKGFSLGEIDKPSLAISQNGTAYMAYVDYGLSNNWYWGPLTVMKFNGTSWVPIGSQGFTSNGVTYPSIAIDGGDTPYVAYSDAGNKATVIKFNGTSWVTVGSADFTPGQAKNIQLSIDGSGNPCIVYIDGNTSKPNVMSFNGTSWVQVGIANFSASAVYNATDAVMCISGGNCVVAYNLIDNGIYVKQMFLNSSLTASGANTVCIGNSITLSGGTAGSYLWSANAGSSTTQTVSVNPTIATTYVVTRTNVYGCANTDSVMVAINPTPTITVNSPAAICLSEQTATLTVSGAINYTWMPGGMPTSSITVSPSITTNYTVTGADTNGCVSKANTTVIVNPLPLVTVNSSTICLGQETATLCANGAITYTWAPAIYLNTTTGACVASTSTTMINYTVTGTDANGCSDTAVSIVTVSPLPLVSYTLTNVSLHTWDAIPTYSGGTPPYTYNWIWGDGTNSTTAYPSHVYSVAGNYSICVTITDANGCSATYCQNDSVYRMANGSMVYIDVVNGTTGINQIAGNNNELNIYPNPNNGSFVIEPSSTSKQTMQVYDVNGKLVLSQTLNGRTSIDASSLNEGVYNISIISNEGVVNKRLVIVK